MERAIAVDEMASALEFLRDVRLCTSSVGGVGVETDMSAGGFDLRNRGNMMEAGGQINSVWPCLVAMILGNVTTALGVAP